jgi:hypothetical protein
MIQKHFRFRVSGQDHVWSDPQCPGCATVDEKQYPCPHRDFGSTCLGLIHAEQLVESAGQMETIRTCDVCFANPQ